jgi:hypothetical protein
MVQNHHDFDSEVLRALTIVAERISYTLVSVAHSLVSREAS